MMNIFIWWLIVGLMGTFFIYVEDSLKHLNKTIHKYCEKNNILHLEPVLLIIVNIGMLLILGQFIILIKIIFLPKRITKYIVVKIRLRKLRKKIKLCNFGKDKKMIKNEVEAINERRLKIKNIRINNYWMKSKFKKEIEK